MQWASTDIYGLAAAAAVVRTSAGESLRLLGWRRCQWCWSGQPPLLASLQVPQGARPLRQR